MGYAHELIWVEQEDRIEDLERELEACRQELAKCRDKLTDMESWNDLMACGHPMWALEYDNEGLGYCAWCKSLEQERQRVERTVHGCLCDYAKDVADYRARIQAALEQARAEEREQCAQIAEHWPRYPSASLRRRIAEAIRALAGGGE